MSLDPRIRYHLNELAIAQDSDLLEHSMPDFQDEDQVILDIGCGIGQSFVASGTDDRRLPVGVDIDLASLSFGKHRFPGIGFVNASAEGLPFRSDIFDVVISRVSLPYTHLPNALGEIYRVLRPGGRLWCTLHPLSMTLRESQRALKSLNLRSFVFHQYVIMNGLAFHFWGRQFAFPLNGRYESFQTVRSMRGALNRAGFCDVDAVLDMALTITAKKD